MILAGEYESVLTPAESACGQIILICVAILHQSLQNYFQAPLSLLAN